MTMLHVSFAKSTCKSLTWRNIKKMRFYVLDFVTGAGLNKLQTSSDKMSSCCTKIRSYSPSVSRCYCYCKFVHRIKGQEISPKMICRIILTNFLLSFSIYLVSLSLYTKLVHRVLFKRHLIFVANRNTMFFYLHILEAPLCLTLQKLAKLDFKPKLVHRRL